MNLMPTKNNYSEESKYGFNKNRKEYNIRGR
jgi:hypothetical protein